MVGVNLPYYLDDLLYREVLWRNNGNLRRGSLQAWGVVDSREATTLSGIFR